MVVVDVAVVVVVVVIVVVQVLYFLPIKEFANFKNKTKRMHTFVLSLYVSKSNSPSGGMKEMILSFSN